MGYYNEEDSTKPSSQVANSSANIFRQPEIEVYAAVIHRLLLLPRASCLFSLNHPVCLHEQVRRNFQFQCSGGLEVDHQLEFRRLFDWQIGWLGAFENFVHERCRAAIQVVKLCTVEHKSPGFHI